MVGLLHPGWLRDPIISAKVFHLEVLKSNFQLVRVNYVPCDRKKTKTAITMQTMRRVSPAGGEKMGEVQCSLHSVEWDVSRASS